MIWWPMSRKSEFEIRLPDVGEYAKENLLAFEKEVLGIYISGHPLEEYEEKWRKMISATTAGFSAGRGEQDAQSAGRSQRDYRRHDHG